MNSSGSQLRGRPRPVLANPVYGRPQPGSTTKNGVRILIALLVLLIAGAGASAAALYWALHRAQSSSSRTVMFHVSSGDTVTTIADRLYADGLVDSPLLFRLDAKIRGLGGKLKVGDYPLRPRSSIDQTVTALTVYHADTISVTVPEGFRIEQIAAVLQRHHVSATSFLREARHPTLHLSILSSKPANVDLEGYLFPSTYEVPPHYSGKKFADYMVRTLDKKFTPAMRAEARSEGWTIHQVLTLASIVEREARVPEERKLIASVYINRLKIGMKLQADPTVQYVVGTPKNWWPVLTTDQLQISAGRDGLYNTYVNKGLPPGPIASPGMASILAVLHPQPTNFYYFVAKGNGHHAFATTYQQQLQNQQKYSTPTSHG